MRAGPGKFILVQEEIRGPRIDEVEDRDEAIIQIARTLAFMHGHTRTTPGPFYRPPNWRILYSPWFRLFPWEQERKPKTIFDSRFETSIRRLDELQQRGGLTAIEARGVTHSMEKARSPIVQDDCYQLIHGDFGPSQVILQDGIPILIDLDTAMFGNFTYELVRAQQTLCRSDRERQLLQDSYFAEAGHGSQDLFNEAKFFFELTYHLGRANHCLKRSIKKNEEDGASHFRQRYQFHKEQLLSFVS
jgi:Ser/Thr protein kinase RdoA (MazF antagonist)